MRQNADSRRCIPLERLFLQAANEKEDRHSITERSCEAQQKFRPKKASESPKKKQAASPLSQWLQVLNRVG
jgi:hypothetical protein